MFYLDKRPKTHSDCVKRALYFIKHSSAKQFVEGINSTGCLSLKFRRLIGLESSLPCGKYNGYGSHSLACRMKCIVSNKKFTTFLRRRLEKNRIKDSEKVRAIIELFLKDKKNETYI